MSYNLPNGLIAYGPDTNCTVELCRVEWSILGYEPSLAANGAFIALFAIAMIVHCIEGIRWRSWWFMTCIVIGCLDEILGYVGRIMLHSNPFSFSGFLIQIICTTTAPVFFCAAIYLTLAQTIVNLDPSISRFRPQLLSWVFIPCDIVSLALQAGGGATSSTSTGSNQVGINISLAGLALQVFTLLVFILASADYMIRFHRTTVQPTKTRFNIFTVFLALSIVLILVRCIYRIDELSDGYSGALFHNEGVFYGLESAMIVLAVFCLTLGHPGFGFQRTSNELFNGTGDTTTTEDVCTEKVIGV